MRGSISHSSLNQNEKDYSGQPIYLSVALAVVAVMVANTIYFLRHGTPMWRPSRLWFRAVFTTALLAYFVVREVRKLKASVAQVVGCALFATILHLLAVFVFRQAIDQLPGIDFMVLGAFEIALVVLLLTFVIDYIRRPKKKTTQTAH